MSEKYIIRIYDETYDEQYPSYFKGFDYSANSFYARSQISEATEFTKEESKETVKRIDNMYKIDPGNGILDHIEILNATTLQVVNIGIYEDEVPTSRFDLMDFEE